MSDARAALGMDRLPWLEDEWAPRTRRGPRDLALWASAAVVLVAGASYWMGSQSNRPGFAPAATTATTVPLPSAGLPAPAPVELAPQPQVAPVAEPEVRPLREPQARVAPERRVRHRRPERPQERATQEGASAHTQPGGAAGVSGTTPPAPAPAAVPAPLKAWPAWQSQGARGRIVRIGAFGTRFQAKLGWRHMVRAFPAVAHLKATVVENRNSRGRPFYRFQIGTTSQAHSEVLCQRMERIRLSCAVVGLPWKPKGVER
jgi:hypothetical protein